MEQYEKLKISLRYYLQGRRYYKALEALEHASSLRVNADGSIKTRKDGKTPSYQHEIEIAHYVRTLESSLMFPEETIIAGLEHDTPEDYGVRYEVMERMYGKQVADAVNILNKHGQTKEGYFSRIGEDPIASLAKGADRIHNLQSMVGVFTPEKQLSYIAEVETYFLPMLKAARRRFPQQEAAYENIKHVLTSQVELLKALHA